MSCRVELRSSRDVLMDPILRRAFSGSVRAQAELVSRYANELRAFVESKTGPKVRRNLSISDLCQETFMKVFRASLETIPEGATLEAFRGRLFQNALWIIQKQARRHDHYLGESSCPKSPDEVVGGQKREDGNVTRADELSWVFGLSDRIGTKYGSTVRLRAQGKDFWEVARVLGITEQAARKRYERAVRAIRACVESHPSRTDSGSGSLGAGSIRERN